MSVSHVCKKQLKARLQYTEPLEKRIPAYNRGLDNVSS